MVNIAVIVVGKEGALSLCFWTSVILLKTLGGGIQFCPQIFS